MEVASIIRPGDKIDLIFKSQVLDIRENGNLEILMPSEAEKLILIPLGVRYEMVFFTSTGLYRALGQVKERYKKDNIYMLEMELKSQLEKYQRREYFRYPYLLDISYYPITEEEAQMESGEMIFLHLQEEDFGYRRFGEEGKVVDLSGGGIRFTVESQRKIRLRPEQYLLFEIHLQNESVDKRYYIVGIVISCERIEKLKDGRCEVRARFLFQDDNVREEIIRFIFEEERKMRQRGQKDLP